MEKEVMDFVDEMWARVDSIIDTYKLPLDIEAKFHGLRVSIEDINAAINDDEVKSDDD